MGTDSEIILAKSSGRGCSLVVQVKSSYRIRIEPQWGQITQNPLSVLACRATTNIEQNN